MSERAAYPSPSVTLLFGDGEYLFRLGIAEIGELQTKCAPPGGTVGIGEIAARVMRGRYSMDERGTASIGIPTEAEWHILDLVETIRLGLVGGGSGVVNGEEVKVNPVRARQLVDLYVMSRPLSEAWTLAAAILTALVVGFDAGAAGEDKKKAEEPATDGSTSQEP